jgi:hypothetical protein
MTFTNWLFKQTKRQDPVGDIARDAKADEHWPKDDNLPGYVWYLRSVGASTGVVRALYDTYMEWEQVERNKTNYIQF